MDENPTLPPVSPPPPPVPPSVTPLPPQVPPSSLPQVTTPHKSKALSLIILGLSLLAAVAAAAFIWFKPLASLTPSPQLAQVTTPPTPTEIPFFLQLTSPAEGQMAIDAEILVSGKTLPGATVLIYTDSDQASVESDTTGNFESTITLVEGTNTLTVTAFGPNGEEQSQSLDVVYNSS